MAIGALVSGVASLASFPVGAMRVETAVATAKRAAASAPIFTDEQMRALEKAGIAKPVKR